MKDLRRAECEMFIATVGGRNTLAVIELIGGETTRRLSARELSGLFFALNARCERDQSSAEGNVRHNICQNDRLIFCYVMFFTDHHS